MPAFQVTHDMIKHIMTLTASHLGALNRDLTGSYSEAPDTAFALAIGAAIGTTLSSFSDPEQKASAVEAINGMLDQLSVPWRLNPVN